MHEIQFLSSVQLYWLYQSGLDQKFRSSSNLGLEQNLPKRTFIESSSLRFDLTFSMSGFAYSSSSGVKQKSPKWNLTESLARGSTKHFASKTLLKVKLYWFSSGLQSNTFQINFLLFMCACTRHFKIFI